MVSAKGYMTNLLGEAFIKLFHEVTADLESDVFPIVSPWRSSHQISGY
jgi:hypothetical protein